MFRCFVFTDVEDSTGNWERHGEEFRESLDLHHAIIREVLREHGGRELTEAGDGFLLCFEECAYALRFAVDAQGRLDGADWPPLVGPLRVRMGIHAGEVEPRENGEYRGLVLNRAARIRDTAHGGQIVCSAAIAPHAERFAPTQELGAFRLRGLPAPERLYQVGDQRSFPPLRAVPAYTHNLPNNLSRFVGREKQIAKVRALLAPGEKKGRSSRLVTLTGPGGTGKTRLALATGESLLTEFSHAVWFVPLADVDDWELIAPSVRDALGIESDPSQLAVDQVAAFIAGEPALFVLDNFEQLAEQGAACIDQLLREMPQLRVLITSRHRLNLPQEREFPVPALEVPKGYLELEEVAEVESVALFADRASQANPSFELTENNTAAVAELCRK
ncbi:MAG: ATP-binding protein, partial [Chthoniobacteraceae bacterium]